MIDNKKIGERLKALRVDYLFTAERSMDVLTQEGLALKFEQNGFPSIDRQRIQKLEKGRATSGIKPSEIEAYCKVFRITSDYILFGSPIENRPIDTLGLSDKAANILYTWNNHEHKEGWFDHSMDGLNTVLEYEYEYYRALESDKIKEDAKKKTDKHRYPLFNDIWHLLHIHQEGIALITLSDGTVLGRDAKTIIESAIMRDITNHLRKISAWANNRK